MLNMPNEKKELYIYSLNDTLTDPQKLEALIAHRAKNSANVKVLCFEQSPHCAHLRKSRTARILAVENPFFYWR